MNDKNKIMKHPGTQMTPELLAAAQNSSSHLSEDDLDEILMGVESPASSLALAHLATCESCGQRLEAFQADLALFNQASLAWSQARSQTLSRDLIRDVAARRPARRITPALGWSSAVSAAVALALTLVVADHRPPAAPPAVHEARAAAPLATEEHIHRPEELASDNAMLQAIASEMGDPRPEQLGILQASPAQGSVVRHTRQVRD